MALVPRLADTGTVPERLAIAERAAREGGRVLASMPRAGAVITSETRRDVKLEADRRSEDRIVDVLAALSPVPVLAEERADEAPLVATDGLRWIVDPLDGTMNYLLGIPFCCVSVGLWDGDEPLVAAVYDFDRDEMFSSTAGEGAWLNGLPIRVGVTPAERAVLCTGFPAATDFGSEELSRFVSQVRTFRKVRMLGSAALSLAYVAAGRADAYYERDIRIWDVAAGLGLVMAAGGEVLRGASSVPHALTVYAHNGVCSWPEHPIL